VRLDPGLIAALADAVVAGDFDGPSYFFFEALA
jgi:hypothetical protein